jgi:hypothetical protein
MNRKKECRGSLTIASCCNSRGDKGSGNDKSLYKGKHGDDDDARIEEMEEQ